MNKILINLVILSVFTIALPANAVPTNTWRTRKTSLSTREQCIQRAFDAMEKAGLNDIKFSGVNKTAVYGETEQTSSTVVCQNGGSLAAIFCASYNYNESREVCDYMAASMNQ